MALTNAGRDIIAAMILGEATTDFNNANARLGVGDSNAVFAVGQVDLQAAANKFRKGLDATYPQRAGNVLTFRTTFATGEANFTWAEWGIFNAAAAGTMLNRKVEALGVKANTQSWQLTTTITVQAA